MLDVFYSKVLQITKEYLKEHGYNLENCEKNDKEVIRITEKMQVPCREFWKLRVTGILREITLILAPAKLAMP